MYSSLVVYHQAIVQFIELLLACPHRFPKRNLAIHQNIRFHGAVSLKTCSPKPQDLGGAFFWKLLRPHWTLYHKRRTRKRPSSNVSTILTKFVTPYTCWLILTLSKQTIAHVLSKSYFRFMFDSHGLTMCQHNTTALLRLVSVSQTRTCAWSSLIQTPAPWRHSWLHSHPDNLFCLSNTRTFLPCPHSFSAWSL